MFTRGVLPAPTDVDLLDRRCRTFQPSVSKTERGDPPR